MVDLQTILNDHRSRKIKDDEVTSSQAQGPTKAPTTAKIPDLFFDSVLVQFKLNRVEIQVLMYLYRQVWTRPNLYKIYGISQVLSHTELAKSLGLTLDDVYHSLRTLEGYGFIATVRSGQYFVRKYFTKDNDEAFSQTYDDFEI